MKHPDGDFFVKCEYNDNTVSAHRCRNVKNYTAAIYSKNKNVTNVTEISEDEYKRLRPEE